MSNHQEYPSIRQPIDIRIETVDDQQILVLQCPLGIARTPILLVPAVAPILSCFQGQLSVAQITERFAPFGIREEIVRELVRILDDGLFLSSPAFFSAQNEISAAFKNSPNRTPALAGLSYAADPERMRAEIEGYLNAHGKIISIPEGQLLALIAPHIDYRRGSACYGVTYNFLRRQRIDLYVIIGTSHQYSRHLFHLTNKDFTTPLGTLRTDREFVNTLAQRYGSRSFADEILHRREHSLELQLPFLAALKPELLRREAAIVPILVGSFHEMLGKPGGPGGSGEYEDFVGVFAETIRARRSAGQHICVVCGVDMAHVGKQFGDEAPLTEAQMLAIAERDRIYLQAILAQDLELLLAHLNEDRDARRICGFPTMYTVVDALTRLNLRYRGVLYDYRQAVDYKTDCAVTFAGAGLYAP